MRDPYGHVYILCNRAEARSHKMFDVRCLQTKMYNIYNNKTSFPDCK